ncbi:MAG: SDR family NAD(P)-dependent oxidoreductase, partial [Planctomycetaceae bacterium]
MCFSNEYAMNSADSSFCSLAGRKALVTGASSGIGRAIALEFARAGAEVLVHCRASHQQARDVSDRCRQFGARSQVITTDLADLPALETLPDAAWRVWGGLDICVNNAGVDLLTGAKARLSYFEKLRELFEVDVRGTMLLSRE